MFWKTKNETSKLGEKYDFCFMPHFQKNNATATHEVLFKKKISRVPGQCFKL
jgi:hypothetical protein